MSWVVLRNSSATLAFYTMGGSDSGAGERAASGGNCFREPSVKPSAKPSHLSRTYARAFNNLRKAFARSQKQRKCRPKAAKTHTLFASSELFRRSVLFTKVSVRFTEPGEPSLFPRLGNSVGVDERRYWHKPLLFFQRGNLLASSLFRHFKSGQILTQPI